MNETAYNKFELGRPNESRVHAASLVTFAEKHDNALVLSGDLTSSTEADAFRDRFPDRFISMGMAEQNMMSFAGGLAREGYLPMPHTFSVFMYRRAFDQIEMSIAYPNLPVLITGFLPGITTPGGVSHQAINDVAVLRSVPNMHILESGDATDVESVLDIAQSLNAPVYLRMIRGSIPRLFDTPMQFNKARTLSEGNDVLLLTTGIMTEAGLNAVKYLNSLNIGVTHLHISTLKPFTDPTVVDALSRHSVVLTAENHSIIGGLGTAVSEVIAENGLATKLTRIAINDSYAHGASQAHLQQELGLDAFGVAQKTLAAIGALDTTGTLDRLAFNNFLSESIATPKQTTAEEIVTTPDEAL